METIELTNATDAKEKLSSIMKKEKLTLVDAIVFIEVAIKKYEAQAKLSMYDVNFLIGLNLMLKEAHILFDKEELNIGVEEMEKVLVYGDGSSWTKTGGWDYSNRTKDWGGDWGLEEEEN